jgi:hypothetical protein
MHDSCCLDRSVESEIFHLVSAYMKHHIFPALLIGLLLLPLATLNAQKTAPEPIKPATPAILSATKADTAAIDTINYEQMMLPENERDYWSLEYYQSDDQHDDGDWDENRRERDGVQTEDRRDQGE